MQLILDKISKDLQAEINTTLRGNKVQECNKVIIQLTNCKDALSIIKPTKLKEISKEYNSLRTEISSKIKFFEELSRNSFPSKTVNNTKPNDSSNDIEPINANNCL